jgi:hypothetical protein
LTRKRKIFDQNCKNFLAEITKLAWQRGKRRKIKFQPFDVMPFPSELWKLKYL